ncbi:putative ferric-chelate reductase 1 isoform X2 [Conger conger]|uniref:putative ferric-chelate reductase 1 isoform X2 n=1 Tax=Conger conger TaxID=82655 RepID=UPI002A5A5A4C|nr:putative ferric-chelate reductase 1 isoform X2 [Conger conger]
MKPRHTGTTDQSTPSPYNITSDRNSYITGDEITVTLQTSSTPFRGFMLQAREVGGSGPVGSFSITDEQAQLLLCNALPNSAVTHTSKSLKYNITAIWRAPTSGRLKDIEFRATFVQNFSTYWLQVNSSKVIYSGEAVSNTTAVPIATTILPVNASISRTGCGTTKVCLSRPSDCDPATEANCYFLAVSASPTDSAIRFEMTGSSGGYISMGFSDDRQMGNDDIYICGLNSNSAIQVQHAYSTGRRAPDILSLGDVSDIQTSFLNGFISCSFTSRNTISTQRSLLYYLMFAYGPTNNGRIQFHIGTFISQTKVDILSPQPVSSNLPPIIKAHGALMLIAWMTTGSLGMLIARYLKAVKSCNEKFWFLGAHPVLGCLVMILAFIQPVAALFRCGPNDKWRFIFRGAHTLNALAIKGLAVAAIFTGLSLVDYTQTQWSLKVMGGFVGWEALLYAIQDINFRHSQNGEEGASRWVKADVMLLFLYLLGNLPFLVTLLIGIGLS